MKATTFFAVAFAAAIAVGSSAAQAGDAAAGEKVFARCKSCHSVGKGEAHRVGPNLHGVVGRKCASTDFPRYSAGLKACAAKGAAWDAASLGAYIPDAAGYLDKTYGAKGAGMTPQKLDATQLADVIAYLESLK
ncbi:MAG: c-type cytochrome [Alphaproteobacteria bacterium]|nr:c-type cytochrome [Alphaproteobacteria bacterium]MBF0130067.1 c-type cytochrome [Alphaproteobacteria bacterium]